MTASGATANEDLFSGTSTPRVGDAAVAIATASHKRITSDTSSSTYFKRELRPGDGKAEVRYRDCDHKIIKEQERCVAALKFYGGEQSGISLPKPIMAFRIEPMSLFRAPISFRQAPASVPSTKTSIAPNFDARQKRA